MAMLFSMLSAIIRSHSKEEAWEDWTGGQPGARARITHHGARDPTHSHFEMVFTATPSVLHSSRLPNASRHFTFSSRSCLEKI